MNEYIIEYPDGSMRIDAEVVRDADDTRLRLALLQFYGQEANVNTVISALKEDAKQHPTDLSILLRPLGWKRPGSEGESKRT